MTKSITVGCFTPVQSLDPDHVQDCVSGQIMKHLYDAPYLQVSADGGIELES